MGIGANVNKKSLFLTSLVAAIPAAILTVMTAMVFLNYSGGAKLAYQLLTALTLVLGAFLTVLPAAILVFGKPDHSTAAKPKKGDDAAADQEEGFELASSEQLQEDEIIEMDDELGTDMEVGDFLDQSSVEEQEMMVVESSSTSDVDEFDLESEDDTVAKKKKKKK
jgi:hypothetical protein